METYGKNPVVEAKLGLRGSISYPDCRVLPRNDIALNIQNDASYRKCKWIKSVVQNEVNYKYQNHGVYENDKLWTFQNTAKKQVEYFQKKYTDIVPSELLLECLKPAPPVKAADTGNTLLTVNDMMVHAGGPLMESVKGFHLDSQTVAEFQVQTNSPVKQLCTLSANSIIARGFATATIVDRRNWTIRDTVMLNSQVKHVAGNKYMDDEMVLIDQQCNLKLWNVNDGSKSIFERTVHEGFMNCEYGMHPRIVYAASTERIVNMDVRCDRFSIMYTDKVPIVDMKQCERKPFQYVVRTQSNIIVKDARMRKDSIFTWQRNRNDVGPMDVIQREQDTVILVGGRNENTSSMYTMCTAVPDENSFKLSCLLANENSPMQKSAHARGISIDFQYPVASTTVELSGVAASIGTNHRIQVYQMNCVGDIYLQEVATKEEDDLSSDQPEQPLYDSATILPEKDAESIGHYRLVNVGKIVQPNATESSALEYDTQVTIQDIVAFVNNEKFESISAHALWKLSGLDTSLKQFIQALYTTRTIYVYLLETSEHQAEIRIGPVDDDGNSSCNCIATKNQLPCHLPYCSLPYALIVSKRSHYDDVEVNKDSEIADVIETLQLAYE